MEDWDYDVEELLGADGSTVCSLVVRFTLPEDVTSAAGLELLFEPEAQGAGAAPAPGGTIAGFALVVRSADPQGAARGALHCAGCLPAWPLRIAGALVPTCANARSAPVTWPARPQFAR